MSTGAVNFRDFMEADAAFNEWNPFRAAWKGTDAAISGLGTGATQVARGLGNTLMTPAHLGSMGAGAAKTIAGLGTADLGLAGRGARQVLRGTGNLLRGPAQIATAPAAGLMRGIHAATNPFSWRKPVGDKFDQFMGLGRAPGSNDGQPATPQSDPQQAGQPAAPASSPGGLPDVIGVDLKRSRELVNRLSMERPVGKWADPKEKVVSALMSSYGRQNIAIPRQQWLQIAGEARMDPQELYDLVGKPYSGTPSGATEGKPQNKPRPVQPQMQKAAAAVAPLSAGVLARLRRERQMTRKNHDPQPLDRLLYNLDSLRNGNHRLSRGKPQSSVTPEQLEDLGRTFGVDPGKIRAALTSGNLQDLM